MNLFMIPQRPKNDPSMTPKLPLWSANDTNDPLEYPY